MRNFFKIGFISAFVILFNYTAKADYIIASDLSYTCLGDLKYEVELTVYVECQSKLGVNLDVVPSYGVSIKSISKKVGTGVENVVFNVNKTGSSGGQEINLFCLTQPTNCAGGTNRGVKKYTFKGQVDLKNYGGAADDWKFFWQQDFRTDKIPTLLDAQLEPYYVEATMDNLNFGCNNSPKFNSDAVLKSFVNEVTTIDLFAKEIDGDELRYKIISPRAFENTNLVYVNGASKDNPFGDGTTFAISADGKITFNAKIADKRGLFDVEIEEYRGGKKIASVTRGIQISTFDNSNDAPELFGFDGKDNYKKTYCVGDKIDIDKLIVRAIDKNKNKVALTYRVTNKNFSFFERTKKADTTVYTFYWPELTSSYVGVHEFIITATDDACPTPKSVTKTYTIEVRDIPSLELGADKIIPCFPATVLNPKIIKGTPPLSYEWFTWDSIPNLTPPYKNIFKTLSKLGTDSTYSTVKPGKYAVRATDNAGCVSKFDNITLFNSFYSSMRAEYSCFGDVTEFKNNTFLEETNGVPHTITSTKWIFDDNNETGIGIDETHKYLKTGYYNPTMIYTTSYNCTDTIRKLINVCTKPKLELVLSDSCVNNFRIVDSTNLAGKNICKPFSANWEINGVPFSHKSGRSVFILEAPEDVTFSTPGTYSIRYTVSYEEKCSFDTTIVFNFRPFPKAFINENKVLVEEILFNCANSDTTLKVSILDAAGGNLTFSWFKDKILVPVNDTILKVNKTGTYTFRAVDKFGCICDTSTYIVYPTTASFVYDTVCTLGNPMMFYDSSKTATTRIKKYEWDFGDSSPISNLKNPSHIYANSAIYRVILTVTDTLDCKTKDTINVYNTTLKNNFKIDPNYRTTAVCAQNILTATNILPVGDTNRIDLIKWYPGDGRVLSFSPQKASLDSLIKKGLDITFKYKDNNNYKITSDIYYNSHPGVHGHQCKVSLSDSITVLPEFDGHIVNFRKCTNDTALFYFVRQTGDLTIGVKSFNWYVAKHNTIDTTDRYNPAIKPENLIFTTTDSAATHYFSEVTLGLDIYLVATDLNNCKSVIRGGASIFKNSSITASIVDTCFGFDAQLQMYSPNEMGLGTTDFYGVVTYEKDTLLYNPFQRLSENKLSSSPLSISFPLEGRNPVKIFVERVTKDEFGYKNYCRNVIDTAVYNDPIPRIAFTWDTVCSGVNAVTFRNLSFAPDNQEIVSYIWDFGDGSPLNNEKNPTHVFAKGGNHLVSLTAETQNCPATKTDTVYVNYQPKAHFYMDVEYPQAYEAIPFVDSSTTVSEIAYQRFDFKDGTTEERNSFTPILDHTYDKIKVYNVEYIIRTKEGCTDTTVVRTDLNVYLTIPTAFSPNGDGNNDHLNLIHKSIEELEVYTIYNRWGEVVFETTNLNQGWDGIYKGKPQEAGVYVVHVKALGAYDTKFNFKQNISLLR